jgi:hypothetical protein
MLLARDEGRLVIWIEPCDRDIGAGDGFLVVSLFGDGIADRVRADLEIFGHSFSRDSGFDTRSWTNSDPNEEVS